MRRLLTRLTEHGYALAVLAIVISTAIFLPGRTHFAESQWALLYLLIVVLVAGASGTGPAILAAILAFFAWDFFFLPPYHTLQVRDPKDWLSLGAFLIVGVVMGIQTGRMREREARALAREHEAALLNRLTANLVSETTTQSMAETVLRETVESLGAASATLFVAEGGGLRSFCASPPSEHTDAATEDTAQWVFSHGQPVGLPACGSRGGRPAGTPRRSPPGAGRRRRSLPASAQPVGRRRRPHRGDAARRPPLQRRRRPVAGLACQPRRRVPRAAASAERGDAGGSVARG